MLHVLNLFRKWSSYNFKKNCEEYNKPNIETINIDGKDVEYNAFLELLGIFIADGSLGDGNSIHIAGEKQRKIEHIYDIANRLGFGGALTELLES